MTKVVFPLSWPTGQALMVTIPTQPLEQPFNIQVSENKIVTLMTGSMLRPLPTRACKRIASCTESEGSDEAGDIASMHPSQWHASQRESMVMTEQMRKGLTGRSQVS
jgi:hypothetical protein